MAWEENSHICINMQLIAILSRTGVDYAICILVRLHFRPADICILLGIDSATLSMKRKRLLKKVYGMDGSAKDFDQRVLKIY